jgi:GTPase Era involved in 16S rRNA processing
MTTDVQQLVADAIDLTGAPPPEVLDADAPVYSADDEASESIYLVGLIGGKDVGKSSLVNALVGQNISQQTSWGEGTHSVIAYAHNSAVEELRPLLEREVPGRHRIVSHDVGVLRRQVLLDLPDIDSHWTEHVQITRRMLRHMLYPIWIQSVEKYADQQPQKLLQQVAEGNDPGNFLFCLNKADQLVAREGASAAAELRGDYSDRIARALNLKAPPRVHLVSAIQRDAFDLPQLRQTLSSQKSEQNVERSIELAGRRRQRSLLRWLDDQQLPQRAQRAGRLLNEAQELTAARIIEPLLDEAVPRLAADPAYRLAMLEPVMNLRLSRWPIVNVIQATLSPLMALLRANLSATSGGGSSAAAMVEAHLGAPGRTVSSLVQTTFAQLRQFDPTIAQLYADRKLWDDLPAVSAAAQLSRSLADVVQRQRELATQKIAGRAGILAAPIRWLLTIGAALWFPIVQPVLERVLNGSITPTLHDIARLLVPLLGASYLLHSAAFLVIWFIALWMFLRWDTQRRLNRLMKRWASADIESDLSLAGACVRWMDELLEPLRLHQRRTSEVAQRLEAARAAVPSPSGRGLG